MILVLSCVNDPKNNVASNTGIPNDIAALSNQIAKDSLSDDLYFQRAQYYYGEENYDGAIYDLIRAINIDSSHFQYYHLLTDACLDYYRSKEAVLTMERCVELFPDNRSSLLKLSEVYLILKQYDESLDVVNRLLSRDQQDAEAFFMLGMNFRAKGEIDKATRAFQTATEIEPELVDAWIILGQLHEEKGDPLAADYYDAAVNVNPNNVAALHTKAFYLQNNNRIMDAIDLYRKISTIDKYYTDAYLNCGILYMNIDSMRQAYEQFDIMVKTKLDSPIAYYYRGQTQEALDNSEGAKEDYTTAITLNPKYTKAKAALSALE